MGGSTAGVMGDGLLLLIHERGESRVIVYCVCPNGALRTQKMLSGEHGLTSGLGHLPSLNILDHGLSILLIFEYLISSSESYGAAMGLFEPAVAHGLAPSAAAASSDALIPKPLAASSGTASACSYESTRV